MVVHVLHKCVVLWWHWENPDDIQTTDFSCPKVNFYSHQDAGRDSVNFRAQN